MKTSQWRRADKNRCVFSARLNALSDRPGDRSAAGTTARQCFMWGELSHGGLLCVTGEVFCGAGGEVCFGAGGEVCCRSRSSQGSKNVRLTIGRQQRP